MPFKQYMEQHVLQPAGLQSTIYDTSVGLNRVQMNTLPGSGYLVSFAEAEGGQPGTYQHSQTARALALTGELSAGIGCSSLQSTTSDIIKWYQVLFTEPEKLKLTRSSIARLVQPISHIYGDVYYGQGFYVVRSNDSSMPYGLDMVYHGGAIWGYKNFAAMRMAKSGPQDATIAAILSNRKLHFDASPQSTGCRVVNQELALDLPCNPNPLMFLDTLGEVALGIDGTELAKRAFPSAELLEEATSF